MWRRYAPDIWKGGDDRSREKEQTMSRFRDLPGGHDRATYSWPRVSCIHPEHGVYEMDVHCLRGPEGAWLIAFLGYNTPSSTERRRQIDQVAEVAREMGDVIEPLEESDISRELAVDLAAKFYANPGTNLIIMQVPREYEN